MSAPFADTDRTVLERMQIIAEPLDEVDPLAGATATAVTGRSLDERGILSFQDAFDEFPNVGVRSAGARAFADVVAIRGLVNTPFFGSPSVSVYVDDVPFGNPYTFANRLYGIDSVAVFRGPQGTLFGRNSYGGVIDINTRKPGPEFDGKLSMTRGNFDSQSVDGYLTGPLAGERLFFSLGGAYAERAGFLKNRFLTVRPDDQSHASGRFSLAWRPADSWDISLTGTVDAFDDGALRLVPLSGPAFELNSDIEGENTQRRNTQAVRIEYVGTDWALLSVTSRLEWRLAPQVLDVDFSPQRVATVRLDRDDTQWTQEFRLRSIAENADWDWRAGLFASFAERRENRTLTVFGAPDVTRHQRDEASYAAFGNVTYHGFDRLSLQAGVRFDHVSQRFARNRTPVAGPAAPIRQDAGFTFASPKVALEYRLYDQVRLYASSALAFKPGGFTPGTDDPDFAQFDSETMWASEVGLRSGWAGDRVRMNLAGFYYDIDDYQVERFFTVNDFFVFNAPRARSYGMELELRVQPVEHVELEAAFGFTRVEFLKFRDPITQRDLSGNRAPFVPAYNLLLAAQYSRPSGWFSRLELVATGKTYFDDLNRAFFAEGDYALVNARVGYRWRNASIVAFGDNLGNATYFSQKVESLRAGAPGAPRTFGIELRIGL